METLVAAEDLSMGNRITRYRVAGGGVAAAVRLAHVGGKSASQQRSGRA